MPFYSTLFAAALAVITATPLSAEACGRNQFVIKYDVGSAEISQKDKVKLKQFAQIAKFRTQVCLFGQADSQGDPEFNDRLAKRRVELVREYLIVHGVDRDNFAVSTQQSITFGGILSDDNERERSVTVSSD